jgi:hypothetical protein
MYLPELRSILAGNIKPPRLLPLRTLLTILMRPFKNKYLWHNLAVYRLSLLLNGWKTRNMILKTGGEP